MNLVVQLYLQVIKPQLEPRSTIELMKLLPPKSTQRNKLTMTEHGIKDCFWACVLIDPGLNGPITDPDDK